MSFEFNTKLSTIFSNTRHFGTYLMQKHEPAEIVLQEQQDAVDGLILAFENKIQLRAEDKTDEPNMTIALKAMLANMNHDQAGALLSLGENTHKTTQQLVQDTLDELKKEILNLNEMNVKSNETVLQLPVHFFKFLTLVGILAPLVNISDKKISEQMAALVPNFEAGLDYNFSVSRAYREQCPVALLHAKDAYYGYQLSTSTRDKIAYGVRLLLTGVLEIPFTLAKNLLLDSLTLILNLGNDILSVPAMAIEGVRLWSEPALQVAKPTESISSPIAASSVLAKPEEIAVSPPPVTPAFTAQSASIMGKKPDLKVVIEEEWNEPLKVSAL